MLKLNHIGIVVKKIEDALPFYQKGLGLNPHVAERSGVPSLTGSRQGTTVGEEVPAMKVKTAKLSLENTVIELIEPMEGNETVSKFLQNRGEGVHHLCFEVEDIKKAMADLTTKGYKPLYPEPKMGAGGHLVNFLSPKDTSGVLIEIAQKVDSRQ
ncbi:MAG: methylmalonyl-CoA epimerase [Planctomycetota bacterium]